MPMMKRFSSSWIRVVEHWVLRVASLVCSLFSAYAIHLFFVPLEVVDHNEQILTWGVAAAFGCLGYIVSRGLVHRLMNKERIWAYVPVVFLVVLVDMACNYILAASAVRSDQWLAAVPQGQQGVLTFITYLILSVIPLMSIVLAVVDMDLERSKGGSAVGARVGAPVVARTSAQPVSRLAAQRGQDAERSYGAGYAGQGAGADAKRAAYWSNRQTQQVGSGGTRSLMEDPEKGAALAGVP